MTSINNRECYSSMIEYGLVKADTKCCGEFNRSDKVFTKCLKCRYYERKFNNDRI